MKTTLWHFNYICVSKAVLFALTILSFVLPYGMQAQTALVNPYLQDAEPGHIWIMWETDNNPASLIHWGLTPSLGDSTSGIAFPGTSGSQIHAVQLTGLLPDTSYFYQARTGSWSSDISVFRTPPLSTAEKDFRLIAMSDMQRDGNHPEKFFELVKNNILPYVDTAHGALQDEVGMVLIPGDLVVNGNIWSQWRTDFFSGEGHHFSVRCQSTRCLVITKMTPHSFFLTSNSRKMGHRVMKSTGGIRIIPMSECSGWTPILDTALMPNWNGWTVF